MANPAVITTWTLLKNQLEDHLNRSDVDDEGVSAMCIDFAEARFNRELRTIDMLTQDTSFTVNTKTETLPTGLLEVKRFTLDRTPVVPLEYLTPEEMSQRRVDHRSTAIPLYFSIVGDNFEFLPTPNGTYTGDLLYYKRIDALGASQATNWLLDDHPDIYLFASLVEAETYLMNDERAVMWETRLQGAMRRLRIEDDRKKVGGTPNQRWRVLGGRARRYVR